MNQFQFMQSTTTTDHHHHHHHHHSLPEAAASICKPLLDPNSRSGHHHHNTNSGQKIFSDGLSQVIHSDRALSLLSSAPAVTREIGFSPMVVQPDSSISQPQSSLVLHNMHYKYKYNNNNDNSPGGQFPFASETETETETKPAVVVSSDHQVSSSSNMTTLHFQEMFQNGPDESSTSGSHQTLTFLWE